VPVAKCRRKWGESVVNPAGTIRFLTNFCNVICFFALVASLKFQNSPAAFSHLTRVEIASRSYDAKIKEFERKREKGRDKEREREREREREPPLSRDTQKPSPFRHCARRFTSVLISPSPSALLLSFAVTCVTCSWLLFTEGHAVWNRIYLLPPRCRRRNGFRDRPYARILNPELWPRRCCLFPLKHADTLIYN